MDCPTCGERTRVIDSEPNDFLYRRRKCFACGDRFTTYEVTQFNLLDIFDDELSADVVDMIAVVLNKNFPTDTRMKRAGLREKLLRSDK